MDKTAKLFPIQHCVNAIQDNAAQAQQARDGYGLRIARQVALLEPARRIDRSKLP